MPKLPASRPRVETSARVAAAGRLALGSLSVRVDPDPLAIHIERDGRSLLTGLELWAADGTVHDHFMQMTEGVIAREELGATVAGSARAELESASERSLGLAVAVSAWESAAASRWRWAATGS